MSKQSEKFDNYASGHSALAGLSVASSIICPPLAIIGIPLAIANIFRVKVNYDRMKKAKEQESQNKVERSSSMYNNLPMQPMSGYYPLSCYSPPVENPESVLARTDPLRLERIAKAKIHGEISCEFLRNRMPDEIGIEIKNISLGPFSS